MRVEESKIKESLGKENADRGEEMGVGEESARTTRADTGAFFSHTHTNTAQAQPHG